MKQEGRKAGKGRQRQAKAGRRKRSDGAKTVPRDS